MTDTLSMQSAVDVDVDPATAFVAFTEEMNSWWLRSPISFYDAARAIARRCEPGVGGRILEVYSDSGDDVLELGRITTWEPGVSVAWRSSVDDIEVEVHFDPIATGTNVRVEARIVPGGDTSNTGSFSWVRVTPGWFGDWCARRATASREPQELSRLNIVVYYSKPATAARWLVDVFGFELKGDIPAHDDEVGWIEFHLGNGALIVLKADGPALEGAPPTHMPFVYVDDLDAHYARAEATGARIVDGIHQHGYRAYVAEDLDGHRWTFAQARPTMA